MADRDTFGINTEFVKSLQSSKPDESISVVKTLTIFETNNKSNKYNWNESFVEQVIDTLYKWYINSQEIFYTAFARSELGCTHNTMCKHLQEYPQQWTEIRDELDHITTERLFKLGSTGKIDKELTKLALKHLGNKWNDAQTMKMEVSIEESLEQAYKLRLAAQAVKGL